LIRLTGFTGRDNVSLLRHRPSSRWRELAALLLEAGRLMATLIKAQAGHVLNEFCAIVASGRDFSLSAGECSIPKVICGAN
jgi:hypothetical protein